jgi:hypothetical protein
MYKGIKIYLFNNYNLIFITISIVIKVLDFINCHINKYLCKNIKNLTNI